MKNIKTKIIRKVDSKNRVILPKEADKVNEYYVTLYKNGKIELEPVKDGGK